MNMPVAKDTVVTLDYNVTDPDGEVLDEGREPLVYLHGGYDDIFPRIEEALQNKKIGETVVVKLQPDEAFGEYDPTLVQMESLSNLPEGLEVGMAVEGAPEGAEEDELVLYRVTDITGDKVILDGNHPLASSALVFTCTVTAVRPAGAEEIRHGHVHGDEHDEPTCH
ncbi:MAG: peptidylprolyl isomerase [Zoogloeaceae bacterium]|jgi:FKBP-type peptidyl-prolyl cis-trans isomerase SlyD|nr:peptidylprolyl isomerase [Zoogloeaceae bacterium]